MKRAWFGVLSAVLLLPDVAKGQTTGRIEGTVHDPAGARLSAVEVAATGPRLQGARRATTDADGRYRLYELPPGPYRVRITAPGFAPQERNVMVALDSPVRLDVEFGLAVAENVAASADRPIDLATSTSGTAYGGALVARLPVARNYADVVRSNPGVSFDKGETQGRSLALTIYGSTSVENEWIIDGVNTANVLKGFQGKAINNEFIDEVEVKSGGYGAEYGGAFGGVVNVITRSGGNAFHGGTFVYYDSDATTAAQVVREDVDSPIGMRMNPDRRYDYGFDLGGYVLRDRLWFFLAYNRVDAPGSVSPYFGDGAVPATTRFPRNQTDDLYAGKITGNLGKGGSLVASVFSDPSEIQGAALVGTGLPTTSTIQSLDPGTWESRRKLGGTDAAVRFSEVVGSSLVASAQGSRHEDRFELLPSGAGEAIRMEDFTCGSGSPEDPCPIDANEPNFVSGGLGEVEGETQRTSSLRHEARGDVTFSSGRHEVRVGAAYQNGRTEAVSYFTGGQLVRKFDELGQTYYRHEFFLHGAGDPTPADRVGSGRAVEKSAYAQDAWGVGGGVTVNAGIRWDQEGLRESSGRTVMTTSVWQPRLGVVWDPKRDGSMRVYGFLGRFSYAYPTDLVVRGFGTTARQVTYNFDPLDRTPDPRVIGHPPVPPDLIGAGEQVDAGLKGAYQDELSVGVDRMFGSTLSVGVKGTYRRLGRWIEDRCDLDISSASNGDHRCAFVNPGSSGKYARGDFDACNGLDSPHDRCGLSGSAAPRARRVYQGIEVLARKTVASRLWAQASYAYSSLKGNLDGGVNENFAAGQTEPGWNADFDYPDFWVNSEGRLFLDRPHQARLDATYTLPFGLFAGLGAYAQSGSPLNKRGYFNAVYGGANIFLVPRGKAGRMPSLWEANLTVGYPLAIGPATATVQLYLFNVFNNQIPTNQSVAYTAFEPPEGYPYTLHDPNVPSNNDLYGTVLNRQPPRLFRASLRVTF